MLKLATRTSTVIVAALAWAAATGSAVRADIGDPVNCVAYPTDPACVIQISATGGTDGGARSGTSGCRNYRGEAVPCTIAGKGWYGGDGCWYKPAEGSDLQLAQLLGGAVDPPAYWYLGSCGDPLTNFWPAGLTRLRVFGTDPGIQLLAQEAIRHLNLPRPQIRLNPDSSPTDAAKQPVPQVVFVPMWMWIDPAGWAPRSATASIAGLSVTAVGTPAKVTWSTGDNHHITCGQGTAWTPGTDPMLASPDCGHTYSQPSRTAAGATFTVTATITWRVTWSGAGTSGAEPALTSTASVPVAVIESAAVNT